LKSEYKVLWASVAEKDFKEIIEFIAVSNPLEALKIFENIRHRVSALHSLPERGRIVPELQKEGVFLYRELVVAPWRIIYRISQSEVFVLAVLDARQNVEDIILRRLLTRP